MVDLPELYTRSEAGRSQSQIADSVNLDRKTVRRHTAPLAALGLEPGGPPAGEQVREQRIAQLFPEVRRAAAAGDLAADRGAPGTVDHDSQALIVDAVDRLADASPNLGRPLVDRLQGAGT